MWNYPRKLIVQSARNIFERLTKYENTEMKKVNHLEKVYETNIIISDKVNICEYVNWFLQMCTIFSIMSIIHMPKLRRICIKTKEKQYNPMNHMGND